MFIAYNGRTVYAIAPSIAALKAELLAAHEAGNTDDCAAFTIATNIGTTLEMESRVGFTERKGALPV